MLRWIASLPTKLASNWEENKQTIGKYLKEVGKIVDNGTPFTWDMSQSPIIVDAKVTERADYMENCVFTTMALVMQYLAENLGKSEAENLNLLKVACHRRHIQIVFDEERGGHSYGYTSFKNGELQILYKWEGFYSNAGAFHYVGSDLAQDIPKLMHEDEQLCALLLPIMLKDRRNASMPKITNELTTLGKFTNGGPWKFETAQTPEQMDNAITKRSDYLRGKLYETIGYMLEMLNNNIPQNIDGATLASAVSARTIVFGVDDDFPTMIGTKVMNGKLQVLCRSDQWNPSGYIGYEGEDIADAVKNAVKESPSKMLVNPPNIDAASGRGGPLAFRGRGNAAPNRGEPTNRGLPPTRAVGNPAIRGQAIPPRGSQVPGVRGSQVPGVRGGPPGRAMQGGVRGRGMPPAAIQGGGRPAQAGNAPEKRTSAGADSTTPFALNLLPPSLAKNWESNKEAIQRNLKEFGRVVDNGAPFAWEMSKSPAEVDREVTKVADYMENGVFNTVASVLENLVSNFEKTKAENLALFRAACTKRIIKFVFDQERGSSFAGKLNFDNGCLEILYKFEGFYYNASSFNYVGDCLTEDFETILEEQTPLATKLRPIKLQAKSKDSLIKIDQLLASLGQYTKGAPWKMQTEPEPVEMDRVIGKREKYLQGELYITLAYLLENAIDNLRSNLLADELLAVVPTRTIVFQVDDAVPRQLGSYLQAVLKDGKLYFVGPDFNFYHGLAGAQRIGTDIQQAIRQEKEPENEAEDDGYSSYSSYGGSSSSSYSSYGGSSSSSSSSSKKCNMCKGTGHRTCNLCHGKGCRGNVGCRGSGKANAKCSSCSGTGRK